MSFIYSAPGSPRNPVVLHEGYNEVTVSWDGPDDDGGSPVTRYVMIYKPAADETWIEYTNHALQNSVQLTGLKENTKYMVRIYAQNLHGNGLMSTTCEFTTKKPTGISFLKYFRNNIVSDKSVIFLGKLLNLVPQIVTIILIGTFIF